MAYIKDDINHTYMLLNKQTFVWFLLASQENSGVTSLENEISFNFDCK